MDKIRFDIIKNEDYKVFKVELFLNDKKVNHNILNLIELLSARNVDYAEFDLYTCSCGVSGCAGFNDPITQNKTKKEVKWLISDDYITEKKLYVFDILEFESELNDLYDIVIELNNNKYCEEHLSGENEEYFKTEKPLKKMIRSMTLGFKNKSKFLDFCNKEMPFFSNLTISYNGFSESVSKTDLVCMIINEWPSYRYKNTKDEYSKLVKDACDAINSWVLNKDISKVKEIDKKSYSGINDEDLELNFLNRFTFKNANENNLSINDNEVTIYNEKEEIKETFNEEYLSIS